MDNLKARCESCRLSLTQIIVRVRNSSADSSWARTTENSWISQRTRLKLWVADLVSLNAELEREHQSCAQALSSAGFSAIIEDLEQDLAAVLEIARGERLPYEEQQPVESEVDDRLSDEGDEEFYEIPERLQAIEDVVDRLFRASNSQFDRILLLQSANARSQRERPEQQSRDKGKGKAAQKPQKKLTDASNLPAQTSLAIRPPPLETHFGRASSASADSRPEHVVPTPTPIAVAAGIDKPLRLAPAMEWRNRDVFTEATRGLDQQEATPSSSTTSPPQQGRYFSFAGLSTGVGGGGPEVMVATREGTRPQHGQYRTSQPATRHSDFDHQSARTAAGDRDGQDRLSASFYRHRYGPYDLAFSLPDAYQRTSVHQEEERRSPFPDLESPPYELVTPPYELAAGRHFVGVEFKAYQREFFRPHRVFALQPSGSVIEPAPTEPFDNIRDEDGRFWSICRFVILEDANPTTDHFTALPILTYGGQGVAAEGVVKSDHGIIHSGRNAPEPGLQELPRRYELGMVPNAVRIVHESRGNDLHARSRINYGKPTRVPLSLPVLDIGTVHRDSRAYLIHQYNYVQNRRKQEERPTVTEDPRRTEAAKYQTEFNKHKEKGQPEMAILQHLIAIYQRSHPGLTWEAASRVVQELLRYQGNN